ncbi:hypothetical protein DMENIID0001_117850 [Sergentomyia squamirostris]
MSGGYTSAQGSLINQGQSSGMYSVPTNNMFTPVGIHLDDFEGAESTEAQLAKRVKKNDSENSKEQTKTKVPPITITSLKLAQLNEFLATLKIKDYVTTYMSIGIKLALTTTEHFETVTKFLQENRIQFFKYQLSQDRLLKYVLSGLTKMPISDVVGLMSEANLAPVEVKEMNIQKRRYDEQCNYIVYFKKGSVNLERLKQVKYLGHMCVKWDVFTRRELNSTVLQCNNCCMFGHMARNCHRNKICPQCSENHEVNKCTIMLTESGDPQVSVTKKCINCSGNHDATDIICPKRAQYVTYVTQQQRRQHPRGNNSERLPPPPLDQQNFPQLRNPAQDHLRRFQNQLQEQQASYSQNVNRSNTSDPPLGPAATGSSSYAHPPTPRLESNNSNQTSGNLFSFQEINELTTEIIEQLGKCSTRKEQFDVIMHLTIKYLYSHHG